MLIDKLRDRSFVLQFVTICRCVLLCIAVFGCALQCVAVCCGGEVEKAATDAD